MKGGSRLLVASLVVIVLLAVGGPLLVEFVGALFVPLLVLGVLAIAARIVWARTSRY